MTPRIFAIIVAFHPEPGQLERLLATIQPQLEGVVLVCNSPLDPTFPPLTASPRVIALSNQRNVGLAAAQNIGLRLCAEHAADFVLFLDQDSQPPAHLVEELLAVHDALSEDGEKVAAVGPCLCDPISGKAWPFQRCGWFNTRQSLQADPRGACRADYLFSSGSLVKMDLFRQVGGFIDALFIDHVDLEWCFRAAAQGWRCFGIPSLTMAHQVGTEQVSLFGRLHPLHAASRDYFVFRNSVALLRLPHLSLRWKSNELLRLIPRAVFYSFLHPRPLRHLAACLRGMGDGLRMTSLPPATIEPRVT